MSIATHFIEQLAKRIATEPHCFCPHGGLTKRAMLDDACRPSTNGVERIDLRSHRGVVTYDPSEFLLTARSGTTVRELMDVLSAHGQYLPFDPLFSTDGSTIGGSIAAGLSGPSRLLYGGIRDFVMEVELIDGLGKLVRGGGKVVKNAAGFDLPKLIVGSYGRMGILTEITLKVFPQPAAFASLSFSCGTVQQCVQISQVLQSKPLPIAAIDFGSANLTETNSGVTATDSSFLLHARFAGPTDAMPNVLKRALALANADAVICENDEDAALWRKQAAFVESPDAECLTRIATHLGAAADLTTTLADLPSASQLVFSAGGAVAYLQATSGSLTEINRRLQDLKLAAILVNCSQKTAASSELAAEYPYLGDIRWRSAARRIQQAMDPHGRFMPF